MWLGQTLGSRKRLGGTQLKDCYADKPKSSLEKAKFEESPAFVSKCGPQGFGQTSSRSSSREASRAAAERITIAGTGGIMSGDGWEASNII